MIKLVYCVWRREDVSKKNFTIIGSIHMGRMSAVWLKKLMLCAMCKATV